VKEQAKKKKDPAEEIVKYKSGNDIVIQPIDTKEPTGYSTLVNIAIGTAIGLAVAWFLVLPARVQSAKAEINAKITEYSELLDTKTSKISELESSQQDLQAEVTQLQTSLDGYTGTDGAMAAYEQLLDAMTLYLGETKDPMAIATILSTIDQTYLDTGASEKFKGVYTNIVTGIGEPASAQYYTLGMNEYNSKNYPEAITNLLLAVKFNAADGNALFNLGNAYRENENKEEAIATFNKVIELFPGTNMANKSQKYLDEYDAK